MSASVKGGRPYRSPKRQAQAAATRRGIEDAAHALFLERGYAGASLADVAKVADVSLPTVKLVFRTKASLLRAVWDRAVKGGDDPRPVADQPWFQDLLASPDPGDHLELQAMASARVKARIAALAEVIRAAAPSDPEIAALWSGMQAEFYANQRATIRALRRKTPLRNGVGERQATDILWTLNSTAVYQLLVGDRGWTSERYQRWLAATLREQLLPPEDAES